MLDLYVESKGEAYDSYFDMNCFLDAFLFMLVSVEDIAPPNVSANFRKEPAFVFLKQLRNLTTHHAIAAGSIQGSKFLRPLSREVWGNGGGGQLFFNLGQLVKVFDAMAAERPRSKPILEQAKAFAATEFPAGSQVYVEVIFRRALNLVWAALP